MRTRMIDYLSLLTPGVVVLGLAACPAESLDGHFLPSCAAYAGDTLTVKGGTFEWDKFTDEVVVDSAGNKIDKYPQHPVKGSYSVDGQRVKFESDAGVEPGFSHLLEFADDLYLLTDREYSAWIETGTIPRCALVFRATSQN